jgi:hypothetical protein
MLLFPIPIQRYVSSSKLLGSAELLNMDWAFGPGNMIDGEELTLQFGIRRVFSSFYVWTFS